ncbi:hypothetical protein HYFRA_00006112 [Hymenoscyphus fraxineus]|uniref:Uncharacterized protein n=1 Tax=Hymenoscyphus fraxineus TaxID=746836 RepID=A0A9N9LBL0_9HELO|nr:hypothetical protein HYFRA_00006112 [Hymenoscyphus fraxineus]
MTPSPPKTRRASQGRRLSLSPELSPRTKPGSETEFDLEPPSFEADSPEGDINRTYADMNLLVETIEDHIAVLHSEMGHRARDDQSPENRRIEAHLESQKYPTPKGSISSKSSGSSGVSRRRSATSLNTKRAHLWAAQVRNTDFADLMKKDQHFHELMDDMNGISEWWGNNRIEWLGRKTETVSLERALDVLAVQIKNLKSELSTQRLTESKRRAKTGEESRLNKQYNYQRQQLANQIEWFAKQSKLMKAVKARFRVLELDALPSQLSSRRQLSNPFPTPFSYTWEQLRDDNLYSGNYIPSWWREGGPDWWLTNAIQDLESRQTEIENKIEGYNQQFKDCSNLVATKIANISRIEEEAEQWERPVTKRLAEIFEIGHRANAAEKREREDLTRQQAEHNKKVKESLQNENDILHALYEKKRCIKDSVADLQRQLERYRAIWQLTNDEAKHSSSFLKRRSKNGRRLSAQFLMDSQYVHDICCVQHFRHELISRIEEVIHHEDFPYKKKLETIDQISQHHKYYYHYHQDLLNLVASDFDSPAARSHELEISLSSLIDEWNGLEDIFKRAEKVLSKARKPSSFPPANFWPPQYESRESGIMLYEDLDISGALGLLDQPDSRGLVPQRSLLDTIHDFFVSPDIAPNFINISKISFSKFCDFVGNLIEDDFQFQPLELQSFLLFCNECAELFTLKGDIISAIEPGWELLDETLISALPRKKTFVAPRGNDEFESFLLRNEDSIFPKKEFENLDTPRDIDEDRLVRRILRYCPFPVGTEDVQNFLAYYSHTGKYFRYLNNEVSSNSSPILHKIDSGWDDSLDQSQLEYRQLWNDWTALPQFVDDIYKIITSSKVSGYLRDAKNQGYELNTEEELYEFVEEDLHIQSGGGWFGFKTKNKVSKYRFHLFLRWCHDYDQLFQLERPGRVKMIKNGWRLA